MRKREVKSSEVSDESNVKQTNEKENSISLKTLILALLLRIIANLFLFDYLTKSVEYTTPWNSFLRIKEANHIYEEYNISPYKGDNFHLMPIMLKLFGLFTKYSTIYYGIIIILDICSAILIKNFSKKYLLKKLSEKRINESDVEKYSDLVYLIYLFNPMTIGSSAIGSISTIINFGVINYINCLLYKKIYLSAIINVFLIFIYPYYVVLLAPLLIVSKHKKLTVMSVIFATTGSLFAMNCLIEKASLWMPNTFYFYWNIKDLTPNLGLFWYVFVFIFEQYRLLFTWIFQLTSIFPVIPLSVYMKNDPIILCFGVLAHSIILSSYPSYAEAAIIISMYPIFPHLIRYYKFTLIGFGALVASLILTPIMWRMWMITGSGNANFYFAIIVVYNVALILLTTDVFYGHSRLDFVETCKDDGIENAEKIVEMPLSRITPFITEASKLVN